MKQSYLVFSSEKKKSLFYREVEEEKQQRRESFKVFISLVYWKKQQVSTMRTS
jgi:hypothetical protein